MASVLSQIIMRGTIAERPAADTPGRLYFATDESRMYRDNGTTWDEVSPVPGDHATSHELGGDDELALDPTQITGTAIVEGDARLTDAREPLAHAASHGPEGSDPITGIAVSAHAVSHELGGDDELALDPTQITGTAIVEGDARLTDAREPLAHATSHELGGDDELTLDPTQITGTAAVIADLDGYVDTTSFAQFRSFVYDGIYGSASVSSDGPAVSEAEDTPLTRDFSSDADQWQTLGAFSGIPGWSDPTVVASLILHFNKLDAGTPIIEVRPVYDSVPGDPLEFSISSGFRSVYIQLGDPELFDGGTDFTLEWRLANPFDSYTGSVTSTYRQLEIWTGYPPIYGDQRGAVNGVASLDGDGLVPLEQLPDGLYGPTTSEFFDHASVQDMDLADSTVVLNTKPRLHIGSGYTRDFSSGGTGWETLYTDTFTPTADFHSLSAWVDTDIVGTGLDPINVELQVTYDYGGSDFILGPIAKTIYPDIRNHLELAFQQPIGDVAAPVTVTIDWRDVTPTPFTGSISTLRAGVKTFLGSEISGSVAAHAASHEDGGSDELELAPAQITGTAIVETVFAAKGDLLAASADNTPALRSVGTDGQILMADSAQTSGLAWVDNHAEQVRLTVKNMTGTAIAKGKAVYINGVSGTIPTVVLADATDDSTSAYTLGLTGESIADGATGFVITQGIIRNISTTGLTGGAPVWLSETAGEVTATKPTQPAHGVLIGYAVRIHGSNGEIYIFTQNGYELGELHDVLFGTTPVEKNVLSYDATATVWKNRTLADAGIASTAHASTHNAGGSDQMAIDAAAGTGSLRTLGTSSTSAAAGNHTHSSTETINVIIDGGGAAITTGVKADLLIPYACTITAARLLADQSGSIVVDIWKDTYANFPPTVADTVTASAKPTLSSAQKYQDTTLTGWTTSLAAGDYLRINVDSVTTVTRVTLALTITAS
ncbi:hypothetical protein UFOVP1476_35 [uncultured Caudovirales phage]|uniref:Major tropism determinant N-terminal domain-containing protein n=1 Tax=uncultured Caudovirales phage TaxID=2100421 RepID=A0A6J5PNV2_9CAUD|nr:hypothetical protein UFOVP944_11 [uncultured Caudovirales phage]CAB4203247.1 hypothetical protein UFOVP1381_9 [uncultured Caudovirales phage]CAB4216083.1 hypothetical protein UFOVP1476_35 [uncultured Caudovirales phage]